MEKHNKRYSEKEVEYLYELIEKHGLSHINYIFLEKQLDRTQSSIKGLVYLIHAYLTGKKEYVRKTTMRLFVMLEVIQNRHITTEQTTLTMTDNDPEISDMDKALNRLSQTIDEFPALIETVIVQVVNKRVHEQVQNIERELEELREFKRHAEHSNLITNLKRHFS